MEFVFYQGGNELSEEGAPPQTRTDRPTTGCTSFNFTQDGPVGGITMIRVSLIDRNTIFVEDDINRPTW